MTNAKIRHTALTGSSMMAVALLAALPGQAYAQNLILGANAGDNDIRVVGTGQNGTASRVFVGESGRGTLTVQGGGTFTTSDSTYVGARPSGEGIITVTGAGSSLRVDPILYVGFDGSGTVTASGGGAISAANGVMLGANPAGQGTVTVTGAGSSLSSGSYIYLGNAGRGSLDVSNGGSVASTSVFRFGTEASGIGVATVTGTGSSLTAGNSLYIGDKGQGTLTVSNGGKVNAGPSIGIGNASTGVGTATVTGAGTVLGTNGTAIIGNFGRGDLTVSDGGSVSAGGNALIGYTAGSAGTVTVSGSGSSLAVSRFTQVGDAGNGTLIASGGATVSLADGFAIGGAASGVGTATVTGAGTTLGANGDVAIGAAGRGDLTVSNGASVTARSNAYIGRFAGSTGTVTVSGSGSSLAANGFTQVGDAGNGTLTASNGATLSLAGGFALGLAASGVGTMIVTGAGTTLGANGLAVIGSSGRADLTISNGGSVSVRDRAIIAGGAGSTGTVTVSGSGSSLTVTGDTEFGYSGSGALIASNGAQVSLVDGFALGVTAGGVGTATVTGAGTVLGTQRKAFIGASGRGDLTVSDGGKVNVRDDITIAGQSTGVGTVTVTGTGSSLSTDLFMGVGERGTGTLTVANGATVQTGGNTVIGGRATGNGAVTVSGAGSSLTAGSFLTVGYDGRGELTVSNGATAAGQSGIFLASRANSQGVLSVGGRSGSAAAAAGSINGTIFMGQGSAVLAFNHNSAGYAHTGEITSNAPGNGNIRFEAGRTTFNTNGFGFTGTSEVLSGAALDLNGSLGGRLNVRAGGELSGAGTIGALGVDGVVRLGGNGTIGQLSGASAAFNAGSLYVVDFAGNASADSIAVSGTATIASGSTLRVVTPTGTTYRAGDRAVVLSAAGGLTGKFTLEGGPRVLSTFLGLRDGYSATQAFVEVAQVRDFAAAALTANQRAAAGGIQSLGAASPLFNAVAHMPNDASARTAFDALSGEIHPGARSVLARDAYRLQQVALGNRVTGDHEAAGRVWASGWTSDGRLNGNGNAERLDSDSTGVFIGGDVHVGGGLRIGAAIGYDEGKVVSRRGDARADITRKHILAYFDGDLGGLTLRGGVGYTEADLKTARTAAFVSPVLAVSQRLSAAYDGSVIHGYLDASYDIAVGDAEIAPFANVSMAAAQTEAFTETGGSAALGVTKATNDLVLTTAGLRLNGVSLGAFDLSGSAGWRHAFGELDAPGTHRLAGGSAFTVLTTDAGRDAAVLDLKVDWRPSANFSIGAGVGLVTGDGSNDRRGSVSLQYRF
ncbi:MAG TPA: autotransporter domain-containing protein [Novosphingobium sp.]|nr:autotransporter domain-containing protein [Novosphingobium sp.]